ncbi:MAG: DUF169 domain-containing protein [Dehalococcoidales bacterium]|nr:DUF169 domain-containing protein [Dehalococcoidales bacterium]
MPEQVDVQLGKASYSARLKEVLELDGSPVAVAIMPEPVRDLKKWRHKATLCIMVQSARMGAVFCCSGADVICGGGEHLGIGRSQGKNIEDSLVEVEKLVASQDAACRRLAQVKRVAPDQGGYIAFAPLERASFRPQVVIFVGTPFQISRILHLDAFETGEMDAVHGEPLCSGVIAAPITTGKIGISLLDMTCRAFGRYRAEEMAVGVPYSRLIRVVNSIELSSSGSARPDSLLRLLARIPASDKG